MPEVVCVYSERTGRVFRARRGDLDLKTDEFCIVESELGGELVKVVDITSEKTTARELALIKVRATSVNRSEIIEIADIFRASIVDVASDSLTIETTGDEDKIQSLLSLLRGFGIKEIARTGRIAMVRGGRGSLLTEKKQTKAGGRE